VERQTSFADISLELINGEILYRAVLRYFSVFTNFKYTEGTVVEVFGLTKDCKKTHFETKPFSAKII